MWKHLSDGNFHSSIISLEGQLRMSPGRPLSPYPDLVPPPPGDTTVRSEEHIRGSTAPRTRALTGLEFSVPRFPRGASRTLMRGK